MRILPRSPLERSGSGYAFHNSFRTQPRGPAPSPSGSCGSCRLPAIGLRGVPDPPGPRPPAGRKEEHAGPRHPQGPHPPGSGAALPGDPAGPFPPPARVPRRPLTVLAARRAARRGRGLQGAAGPGRGKRGGSGGLRRQPGRCGHGFLQRLFTASRCRLLLLLLLLPFRRPDPQPGTERGPEPREGPSAAAYSAPQRQLRREAAPHPARPGRGGRAWQAG